MKPRIIEDLHGGRYEMYDFHIFPGYKVPTLFSEKEQRIFNKDRITQEAFTLVKFEESGAYLKFANEVWVAYKLRLLDYIKKNDIRYGKKSSQTCGINDESSSTKKGRRT